MATFQSPNLSFSPLPSSTSIPTRKQPNNHFQIKSALQFPDLPRSSSSAQRLPKSRIVVDEINRFISSRPLHNDIAAEDRNIRVSKMYAILEAISDRIEMHANIKEQRDNWNTLLLNSTNMITLTATLAATLSSIADHGTGALGLKISSVILFSAATGLLALMNKIQPSQLVEEQRNAVRHLKQLRTQIQTQMDLSHRSSVSIREGDVADAMQKVLAIDRAYPLPLLGAMLEKFPESFEAARWWPAKKKPIGNKWSRKMEEEMREVVKVVKMKDLEDYERLGSKALKLSKALAMAGPMLMGMAAVGSVLNVYHPLAGVVAGVCGSLASVASSVEHGGQVGMVLEMYRNCAGFFKEMEEDVEDKSENGQLFEMKMALRLGRSLSELRDLAARSSTLGSVDEFANKLF